MEDERPVISAGAGESQPGQSPGVQGSQTELGEIVVSVERMPGSEAQLSPWLGVPAPGEAGLLVTPPQPPPLLSPGHRDQRGYEGGEEVADRGGQGEGVAVVVQQGGLLLLRVYLGQIAWIWSASHNEMSKFKISQHMHNLLVAYGLQSLKDS